LLLMQDLGDETLAERLEANDAAVKQQLLRSAVSALVSLHATAQAHLPELAAEIRKIDKESLGHSYYLNAVHIALERIGELAGEPLPEDEWRRIADQARPLIDSLCDRPSGFIHFEFTPHHLLVTDSGLHVFDFEQATIGPAEFDIAALLAQPESEVGPDGWEDLVEHYAILAAESGLRSEATGSLSRGVAYTALLKCLVYAGAAANFLGKFGGELGKFGGEHHLQRFHYYLDRCQTVMQRWQPLRPLGRLLQPRFDGARAASRADRFASPRTSTG
jgi:aminoglycoside/choline kinase family phosphotransferase